MAGAFWDSCADRVRISFDVAVGCDSVSRSCLSQNGPVTVTRKVQNAALDRKSAVLGVVLPLKKSGRTEHGSGVLDHVHF